MYRLAGISPALLDEVVTFLKVFHDASEELEAEMIPTLHLVLPWYCKLRNHCKPAACDSDEMAGLKENASALLESKLHLRLSPSHYYATILNPKMKSLKVTNLYKAHSTVNEY